MPDLLSVLEVLPECWDEQTAQLPPRMSGWNFDLDNPARYQCSVTSYVLREMFGGEILTAEVGYDKHYWNLLPHGMWLDATRGQFVTRTKIRQIRRATEAELVFQDTIDKARILRGRIDERLS